MNRRLAVRVALVSALLGTLMNAAVNVATDVLPSHWHLGWLSLVVIAVVLGLLVLVETRWRDAAGPARSARDELSSALAARWEEANYGPLDPPGPMIVPWVKASRHVSPHGAVLWAGSAARRLPQVGSHEDVYELYRRTPTRQLVILGEPGSGKTALAVLLLRRMLQNRRSGESLPVLVTLTEWDPGQDSLWVWLSRRIERDFPSLGSRQLVTDLLKERAVVPFLDGLDEMMPSRHAAAIAQFKVVSASGYPFVLTCRTKEYEAALAAAGEIPPRAAVVEMAPVEAVDAFTFLRHKCLPGDPRWEPLSAHVKDCPDGPVAALLSMPLMIWLAAEVYGQPGCDPTGLPDATRFPDRDAMVTHLLDAHLPTVYRDRSAQPTIRWLRFLAGHLKRRNSRDLLWWRLPDELPRWAIIGIGLSVVVACGAAGSALLGLNHPWLFSLALPAVMALPVGIGIGLAGPPPQPARLSRRQVGNRREAWRRLTIGIIGGAIVGFSVTPTSGIGAMFYVVLGILVGSGIAMIGSPDLFRGYSPRSLLAADTSALLAAVVFGLAIGAVGGGFGFLIGLEIPAWLGGGLATFVTGAFVGHILFRKPGADLLRLDIRSAISATIGGVLVGALGTAAGVFTSEKIRGEPSILLIGTVFGLTWGIAVGVTLTSCLWYRVAVAVLWLRGLIPLHVMRFLEDAHRRGVLRQVGAGYQFRHALLQDRLAESGDRDKPSLRGRGPEDLQLSSSKG